MSFKKLAVAVGATIALVVLATCTENFVVDPPDGFGDVRLEAIDWPDSLIAGESGVLQAQLLVDGESVDSPTVRWKSLQPDILWIDEAAVGGEVQYRALRDGQVEVEARIQNHPIFPDTAVGRVIELLLGGVRIDAPARDTTLTALGDSLRLRAVGLDVTGSPIPGIPVTWARRGSSVSGVQDVEADTAVAVAARQGMDTVTIESSRCRGACADTVFVRVDQEPAAVAISQDTIHFASLGQETRLGATVTDRRGHPILDDTVLWSLLQPTDSVIVGLTAEGVATARTNGEAQAIATAGTASDTARLIIDQVVARVAFQASSDTVASGDSIQPQPRAYDASDSTVTVESYAWASLNETIATVNSEGWVQGVLTGAADIIATTPEGPADTLSVTVLPGAVAEIAIQEDTVAFDALSVDSAVIVTVTDAAGNTIDPSDVEWTSDSVEVAAVAGGRITAAGNGLARIIASANGAADTVWVRVHQALHAMAPDTGPIDLAQTGAVDTVDLRPVDRNAHAMERSVPWVWSSSDSTVAVAGVLSGHRLEVTAVGYGQAYIHVHGEGIQDSIAVTVSPDSVIVTPAFDTLNALGDTAYLRADAFAADAALADAPIAWTLLDPAILAAADADTALVALSTGTARVVARLGLAEDTATVAVRQVPGSIVVSPDSVDLQVGADTLLQRVVSDSNGVVVADAGPDSWTSLDTAVATVDGTGLVTAVALGTTRIVATAGALADTATIVVTTSGAVAAGDTAFQDDFEDGTYAATWTVINASWTESGGQLTAGTSCHLASVCPEGPAVLRSPTFPAGDGRFTIEFDTYHDPGGTTAGYSGLRMFLQVDSTVTWDGANGYAGLDRMVGYEQNAYSTDEYTIWRTQERAPLEWIYTAPVVLGEWQRVRVQTCGTGGYAVRVKRLADGSTVLSATDTLTDMTIPADVDSLFLMAVAHGANKAFDNVRVIRGCGTPVDRVVVAPVLDTLNAVGDTVRMTAVLYDDFGTEVTDSAPTWSSLSPDIATVDSDGLVTAVSGGTAEIVAGAGGAADTATVVVRQVVATVTVAPDSVEIITAGRTGLTATVADSNGVTVAGESPRWTSLDSTVASVDSMGNVTGVAVGTTSVVATAGSHADSTIVVVRSADAFIDLCSTDLAFTGGQLPSSWTVKVDTGSSGALANDRLEAYGDSGVFGVGAAVATGAAVTTWELTGSHQQAAENQGQRISFWQGDRNVRFVVVSGGIWAMSDVGLAGSDPERLHLILRDDTTATAASVSHPYGPVRVRLVTRAGGADVFVWDDTSGDLLLVDTLTLAGFDAAQVDSVGVDAFVSGTGAGPAWVDRVTSACTDRGVSGFRVHPARDTLGAVGDTIRLSAFVLTVDADSIPAPGAVWTSLDSAVARVDSTGLVTAAGAGEARVQGVLGWLADTVTVFVDLPGPLAHWGFDETTGTSLVDLSGNGRDGTLGATTGMGYDGAIGTAYMFDGEATAPVTVTHDTSLQPGTAFAVSTWFNLSGFTGTGPVRLIGQDAAGSNGWYLAIDPVTRSLRSVYEYGTETQAVVEHTLPDTVFGEWHHVVAQYDAGSATHALYLDGSLVASAAQPAPAMDATVDLTIGGAADGTSPFWGLLDETRLYGRSLTEAEIADLTASAAPGTGRPISGSLTESFDGDRVRWIERDDSARVTLDLTTDRRLEFEQWHRYEAGHVATPVAAATFDLEWSFQVTGRSGNAAVIGPGLADGLGTMDTLANGIFGVYYAGDSGPAIHIRNIENGAPAPAGFDQTPRIPIVDGTTYYARMTFDRDSITLALFSDSARTQHVAGSPVRQASNLGGVAFNHLYAAGMWHESDAAANPEWTSGWIDGLAYDTLATPPDPTLAAHWPLDGNAVEASGSGLDGTVNGAVPTAGRTGAAGTAYLFNGVDSWIEVAHDAAIDFSGSDDFTVAAWIRTTGTTTGFVVDKNPATLSWDPGYRLSVRDDGLVDLMLEDATHSPHWYGTQAVNDGDWHLIAAVVDRATNTGEIYVDGVLDSSFDISGAGNTSNTAPLGIGMRVGGDNGWFDGAIDEVRIWSRAVTAAEISSIYQAERPAVVDSIVVTPATDTLFGPGDTTRLTAATFDSAGASLARPVAWTSVDTAIATVDSAGLVTAVAFGATQVVASSGPTADTADITVLSVPTDPVVYWPLDGDATDATGNGWDGVLQGATATTDRNGLPSSALHFDGASYVDVSYPTLQYNSLSFCAWVRPDSLNPLSSTSTVFGGRTGSTASIFMVATELKDVDSLYATIGGAIPGRSDVRVDTSTYDGSWHHICVSAATDSLRMFLDGQPLAADSMRPTGTLMAGAELGAHSDNGTIDHHFIGDIDDVRLWDRGITGAEVDSMYRAERPALVDSLAIVPASDTLLALGDTAKLLAATYDSSGTPIERPVAWSSVDSSIAAVDSAGVVTAVAAGITQVVATSGATTDTADIYVGVLFHDDFEDGDLAGWQVSSYNNGSATPLVAPSVESGRLKITVHDRHNVTVWHDAGTGWPDYAVDADVRVEQALDDAGESFWTLFYGDRIEPGATPVDSVLKFKWSGRDANWLLVETLDSTTTMLDQGAISTSLGTEYHVRAMVSGSTVAVYRAPAGQPLQLITHTSRFDPVLASTGAFGFAGGDDVVTIDNVTVYATSALEAPPDTVTPPTPDSVAVTPSADTLSAAGDTVRLTAKVFDGAGRQLHWTPVSWSTADSTVVAVTADGLVTAVSAGATRVIAASGAAADTAIITVQTNNLWDFETDTVGGAPAGWTFFSDWGDVGTIQVATGSGANGSNVVRIVGQSSWAQGIYRPGTSTGTDATLTFDVYVPSGGTAGRITSSQLVFDGFYVVVYTNGDGTIDLGHDGWEIPDLATDTWHTVTAEYRPGTGMYRVSVDSVSSGWVDATTAVDSVGGFRYDLSMYGNNLGNVATYFDNLALKDGVRTVESIAIAPAVDTLTAAGDTTRFTAVARDSLSSVIWGAQIGWTTADSAIATVDSTGLVTAVGAGATKVIAASETVADSATIVVLPTDRVAYWPFDGDATDTSGHGNDGTVSGAVLTADRYGSAGSAYAFNGVDDYIDIGTAVKPQLPVTMAAWIRVDSLTPGMVIRSDRSDGFDTYNGLALHYGEDGTLRANMGDGGPAGPGSRRSKTSDDPVIATGEWIHVAAVFPADLDFRLYVNGDTVPGTFGDGTATTLGYSAASGQIGGDPTDTSPTQFVRGAIDEVQVWAKELSDSALAALYQSELPAADSVEVTPDTGTIRVDSTLQLAARVFSVGGQRIPVAPEWTSLDSAIATADNTGLVTGVSAGAARIVATAGAGTDTARITVLDSTSVAYVSFEGSNTGDAPTDWTFNSMWGDIGTIRVADDPAGAPNRVLHVKGASGQAQGVYRSGTAAAEDRLLELDLYVPDGTAAGNSSYFGVGGAQVVVIPEGGGTFSLASDGSTPQISGLATNTWHHVTLRLDWDRQLARLETSAGAWTDGFQPDAGGGYGSDLWLYGNNLGAVPTYYDNLSLHQPIGGVALDPLVAVLPLDGTAVDSTGNGHDGVLYGPVATTDRQGRADRALSFDGVDDYVELTDLDLTGSFTVSLWARNDTPFGAKPSLIDKYPDWRIAGEDGVGEDWLTSGGVELSMVDNADVRNGVGYETNAAGDWHHIVGVHSAAADELRLYVDGVLQASGTFAGPPTHTGHVVLLGAKWGADAIGPIFFSGALDDIRIFASALTDQQIDSIYQAERPPTPDQGTGPVVYWPLDGVGTDATGNGYDGTVNGAVPTADRNGNADQALLFDGASYVDVSYPSLQYNSLSFCGWVRPDSLNPASTSSTVFGGRTGTTSSIFSVATELNDVDSLFTTIGGNTAGRSDIRLPRSTYDGAWHQICVSAAEDSLRMFMDGEQVGADSMRANGTLMGYAELGASNDNGTIVQHFIGAIDEVRLWDRGITAAEVDSIFRAERPVDQVVVGLAADSIVLGDTTTATATAYSPPGGVVTLYPTTWSSGDTSVATVDSTGLATARGFGSVWIHAEVEGVADSALLTVAPLTDTLAHDTLAASFHDNFEDGAIGSEWQVLSGTWTETGGALHGYWTISDAQSDQGNVLVDTLLYDRNDVAATVTVAPDSTATFVLYNSPDNKYSIGVTRRPADTIAVAIEYRLAGAKYVGVLSDRVVMPGGTTDLVVGVRKLGATIEVVADGHRLAVFGDSVFYGDTRLGLGVYGDRYYHDFALHAGDATRAYHVDIQGGGGYYTQTSLKLSFGQAPTHLEGLGRTDASGGKRVAIRPTPSDTFVDFRSDTAVDLTAYSDSSVYVQLNSAVNMEKDTYMELWATLPVGATVACKELDTHDDDLAYVRVDGVDLTCPRNLQPAAAFTYNCSHLTCSFTDGSTDGDGHVAAWSWDFGDGDTASVASPGHTFSSAGTYTVTAIASDNDGWTDTTSQTVAVSEPGLIARWTFDDCTAADSSGRGHDATLYGGPVCVTGPMGSALRFDGVDDYAMTAASDFLDTLNVGTVSFWVRPHQDALTNGGNLVSYSTDGSGNSISSINLSTERWAWQWKEESPFGVTPNYRSDSTGLAGRWTHVALVANGTDVVLYVDGDTMTTTLTTNGATVDGSEWYDDLAYVDTYAHFMTLGATRRSGGTVSSQLAGELDDVRIYGRPLAPAEIDSLMALATIPTATADTIQLSADTMILDPGSTAQITGTVFDIDGFRLDAATVGWSSDDPAIATVDSAGLVTAVATGQARITASSGAASTPVLILVPDTTAVGFWSLDGSTVDASGHGLNGTAVGAVPHADRFGRTDSAYWFDGANDYLSLPDLPVPGRLAVTAWIKPDGSQGDILSEHPHVVGSYGFIFFVHQDSTLSAAASTDGTAWTEVFGSTNLIDGRWHHVALSIDGTAITTFLDGAQEATAPFTGDVFDPTWRGAIGVRDRSEGLTSFFTGAIDEVRLMPRGLTATEVDSIYRAERPNTAPTAGFSFGCSDLICGFIDGSSDSDGTIASWSWDFGDGNTSAAQDPNHTYSSGGTYSVTLTVTDDDGATDTHSDTITVAEPNTPPTAGFSVGCSHLICGFIDESTDSDGSITGWAWDFGDGATSTAADPNHTYGGSGTYTVTLTVTDDDGDSDSYSESVSVTANAAPTASFSAGCSGLICGFIDGSTDSDGTIASWAWDFGDGATSTAADPNHTYGAGGTYTVTLTVTDDDGTSDSDSKSVTVVGPTGTVTVTTSTTGTNIPAGSSAYYALIDYDRSTPISANGSITWNDVATGSHTVTLGNVDSNCTVSGGINRSISVSENQTTSVSFAVTCM